MKRVMISNQPIETTMKHDLMFNQACCRFHGDGFKAMLMPVIVKLKNESKHQTLKSLFK